MVTFWKKTNNGEKPQPHGFSDNLVYLTHLAVTVGFVASDPGVISIITTPSLSITI